MRALLTCQEVRCVLLYFSMPALPDVPNVLLVTLVMGLNDDLDVVNRYHIGWTGGSPNNTQLDSVATQTAVGWTAQIAPNVHENLSLTHVGIVDLTSPTSASGTWDGVIGGTGTSGAILGAGSAVRINRVISRRYRGGRPGVFLPLTSSAYIVSPQTLTGAYITAIQSAWAELEDATIGEVEDQFASAARSVSVSYYEGFEVFTTPSGRTRNIPKLRTGGPVVDNVTDFKVNDRVASQRRRNLTRS